MTDIIKFRGNNHKDDDSEEDQSWLDDLDVVLEGFDEDEVDGIDNIFLSEDDEDFDEDEEEGLLPNIDVPEEVLETIYAMGYEFYERKDLEKAGNTFGLLCMLSPFETKFWMGLAAATHMMKDYHNALGAYATAALLNPENPLISLNAAECCFAIKDVERGLLALDAAEEIANDNKKDYAEILAQVALLREAWGQGKKKISSGKNTKEKSNNKKK